jgi:hypothetical protein
MKWTEEMIETFKTLANEEPVISYGDIAKRMNKMFGMTFTKNSMVGKARRLKMLKRPAAIIKRDKRDKPIMFEDLRDGMCKWPLGKVDDKPPFSYCGAATDGSSWCAVHRKRVFNRSSFGTYEQ